MRQHHIGAATVKGDPLPQRRKPSPAACGTQIQEIAMSENFTDPAAGTDTVRTESAAQAEPTQQDNPAATPTEVAASEPVAVESEPAHEVAPAPVGDTLPTVADFIAPIGGGAGRGEVALDAKALKVSFNRTADSMSFSVEAETVTLTGKRG